MAEALLKVDTLSAISRDIAQVLFAGLFIEPIVSGEVSVFLMLFGFTLSLTAWVACILLAKA